MQEYYLAGEAIKEETCFISQDIKAEMMKPTRPVEYYVLPDPDIRRRG